MDDFTIEDGTTHQITLTSLTTGINSASIPVTVTYKTNLDSTYRSTGLAASYSGTTVSTITVASLGLASGEYITGVRWYFGTVPAGFTLPTKPTIAFKVLSPDPTGTTVRQARLSKTAVK